MLTGMIQTMKMKDADQLNACHANFGHCHLIFIIINSMIIIFAYIRRV